jgi:hypothetical protein
VWEWSKEVRTQLLVLHLRGFEKDHEKPASRERAQVRRKSGAERCNSWSGEGRQGDVGHAASGATRDARAHRYQVSNFK